MNPIPKVISLYALFLIIFWTLVGAMPFISPKTMSGLLSMQIYGSVSGIVYMWGIQNIIMSIIIAVALNSKSPRFLAWMFVMRFVSEVMCLFVWLSERTVSLGDTLVTVELKSNVTSSTLSTSTFGSLMLIIPILLLLFLIPEFLCARRLFRISDALKMGYGGVMYQPSFYREWEGPILYPYATNPMNPNFSNLANYDDREPNHYNAVPERSAIPVNPVRPAIPRGNAGNINPSAGYPLQQPPTPTNRSLPANATSPIGGQGGQYPSNGGGSGGIGKSIMGNSGGGPRSSPQYVQSKMNPYSSTSTGINTYRSFR